LASIATIGTAIQNLTQMQWFAIVIGHWMLFEMIPFDRPYYMTLLSRHLCVYFVSCPNYSEMLTENRQFCFPHLYLIWNFTRIYGVRKHIVHRLLTMQLWLLYDRFSHFSIAPDKDGWTDRQTDRRNCYIIGVRNLNNNGIINL